jgi:hypothetical protein
MKIKVLAVALILGIFLSVSEISAQTSRTSPAPVRTPNAERVRSCQAREEAVTQRMAGLTRMAKNMIEVFEKISGRVQTFYTDVVLPSGKSLPNYDALIADIAAKKQTVLDDLSSAEEKLNGFSCDSGDPAMVLREFRQDMQQVKTDLAAYRKAIRNLIVAVKPLAPESTEEPRPTGTPGVEN